MLNFVLKTNFLQVKDNKGQTYLSSSADFLIELD